MHVYQYYSNSYAAAVLSTQNQQALLFLFLFLCARPFSTESIWLHLICLDDRPIQGSFERGEVQGRPGSLS